MQKVILHISLLLLLGLSASAQRGGVDEQGSLIKRIYHNTNARYNGFFLAELRINRMLREIKASADLDYTQMLPIYPYLDSDATDSYSNKMDEVIKHTSKVIKKHPTSKWVDDCYLLMGKGHFFKGDYEEALEAFIYITTEYQVKEPSPERYLSRRDLRKRNFNDWMYKKGIKHRPAYFDAAIWQIHTHIELGNYEDAQTIIDLMEVTEHFPERLMAQLFILQSHLYTAQEKYDDAFRPLEDALDHINKQRRKGYYAFVLGQIAQEAGNNPVAIEYFNLVLSLNPSFDMEFNAKMNMARTYDGKGGISARRVKNMLHELANDEKNYAYRDQIYYLLARIALKEGKRTEGIQHLKRSVQTSVDNDRQKGLSYKELGDLYFEDEVYRKAKFYYDSTTAFLPEEHEEYGIVSVRHSILDELVTHLVTVETEDSLQHLANLPEREREAIIDEKIQNKLNRLRDQREALEQQASGGMEPGGIPGMPGQAGKWYFYNESAKQQGYQAFVQMWGERKLEDDWRRSQKSSGSADFGNEEAEIDETAFFERERKAMLENIPFGEEAQAASDARIREALYQSGIIFRTKLENHARAVEALETLNERFPQHEHELEAAFFLYLSHKRLQNISQSDEYKKFILDNYPNSKYAKIIRNPDYREEDEAAIPEEILAYYEQTYSLYSYHDYDAVLRRADRADSLFEDNPMKPRFDLLKAFAYARTRQYKACQTTLEHLVEQFPNHEVSPRAEGLIKKLKNEDVRAFLEPVSEGEAIYAYAPTDEHYLVLIPNESFPDINQLNIAVSDFNKENFSLMKDLQVSNIMLTPEINMLLVKGLPNGKKGLKYQDKFEKNAKLQGILKDSDYTIMLITKDNFKTFYKEKNTSDYLAFFEKNYSTTND